jgi:hypothetical protein
MYSTARRITKGFLMNRKLIFWAMLVGLLALSLGFVACDNGTTGGDPTDSILDDLGLDREKIRELGLDTSALAGAQSGDYVMVWGAFEEDDSMPSINTVITNEGWDVTSVSDGRYSTSDAAAILNYCINNLSFFDGGGSIDSYSALLNYTVNGEGLTPNLKAAMAALTPTAIAGVFETIDEALVVFFIAQI